MLKVPPVTTPTEAEEPTTLEARFRLSEEQARRQSELEFEEAGLELIEATIKNVSRTGYGKFVVTLDNGQRWRQVDSRKLRLEEGDGVRISSAKLGAVLLEKRTGSRMIRVQRVQ